MREAEKNSCTEDLVDKNYRQEALKFGGVIWRRVDPVPDARIAVGDGIENEVTENSCAESGDGAARNPVGESHSHGDMDGGEHGVASCELWLGRRQKRGRGRDRSCHSS